MKANLRAHLSVLIVNLIYGANFSIAKQLMPEHIKPMGFIVVRVIPSAVLFFVVSWFLPKENIERKDKWTLVWCALFGVAINQMLFFKGLSLTYPINGALIMTTNPILVLLMAALLLKEKIGWNKVVGIILGITGAATLILFGKKFSIHDDSVLGDFYIFVNSLSFAIFMIMVKPLMMKYHPLTVTKWVFFFGSFMVLPFGYSDFMQIQWTEFAPKLWACFLFVIIAVTFFAYIMNIYALRELSPSVVSSYIYFQPLFATAISLIMLEGKPNILQLIAAVLIFTGVYLVSGQKIKGINTHKE